MGDSSSKEAVENCDNLESRQHDEKMDKQLEAIRTEVSQMKPLITENVKQQLTQEESSVVLRYSELDDPKEISKHIHGILMDEKKTKNEHAVQLVMEAAKKMVAQFQSNDEMKKLSRWNQVKKVMKCGQSTAGMELHYKIVIIEEKVGALAKVGRGSKDTVFILGYKFIVHALDVDPACLPDDKELQALAF